MPQFTESESPWSQLAAALQETTALKEHATVTGLATDTSAPQRIVLSPLRGPFKPRAKRPAIIDVDLQIEARIWAESDAHAWDLLVRLVRAVAEYGVSGGPLVEWDEVDFDAPDDTSGQGAPCVARFTLRALPIAPAAADRGRVDSVTYGVNGGPTTTITE